MNTTTATTRCTGTQATELTAELTAELAAEGWGPRGIASRVICGKCFGLIAPTKTGKLRGHTVRSNRD
jgi:hypothetical protein